MPQVGFEPTISVFERAKAVHASDQAVTVIIKTAYDKQITGPLGYREVHYLKKRCDLSRSTIVRITVPGNRLIMRRK
jgi:hypothetical protein